MFNSNGARNRFKTAVSTFLCPQAMRLLVRLARRVVAQSRTAPCRSLTAGPADRPLPLARCPNAGGPLPPAR
jgi:hypothetical protein